MAAKLYIVLSAIVAVGFAQRSPYAGRRPVGYPELEVPTTTTTTTRESLGNRFGEDQTTSRPTIPTTTMRLPIEALGDRNLVDRISKLPVDQQPFWYINWKFLEANRQKPQTFPQRVNSFIHFSNTNSQGQSLML